MTTRIKLRRDTAANWASENPVLALGEPGFDTTNNSLRIGDGTTAWGNLTAISGSGTPLSGNVVTNTLYDTLQSGLPTWLEWNDRGGIYTENTHYGSDDEGVWFSGSEDTEGGEGGAAKDYALPLQTAFTIANTVSTTVTVEFKYDTDQNDHVFGFHLSSQDPVLVWDGTGNAGQVFLQINGNRPKLYYPGNSISWTDTLTTGHVYKAVLGILPSAGEASCEIYDLTANSSVRLDNATKYWEGNSWTGSYSVSFGADNDYLEKSYYRNLKIHFEDPQTITQGVTFTANAQIQLPGGMLIGNFRDEDYVVWAPEHAEYVGLWWGGDRGGDVFAFANGYGPNVAVQAGRIMADDSDQQYSGAVPETTGNRDAEGIVMTAGTQGWVFHENGNIYLPPGGTIRDENNLDVLVGTQGVVSDWGDGINDNVWRIVNHGGTKEFNFDTPGLKEIVMTAQATVNNATGIVFSATTYPTLTEFVTMTSAPISNSYNLYLGNSYGTEFANVAYTNNAGNITFSFDAQTITSGANLVLKFYSEGTLHTGSGYDSYDAIADATATNTNTFLFRTAEWNNYGSGWAALLSNVSSHSVTINPYDESRSVRNLTEVTDNGNGTYTIAFDGTPVDIKTLELTTISSAQVTNSGSSSAVMTLSQTSYPDFGRYCHRYWQTSVNERYTGNTVRSGYLTIDGGGAINFNFSGGVESTNGDWELTLATAATWTPSSTIVINYYRQETHIRIDVFEPNNSNLNNGYKWLNWKEEIPEFYPTPSNGIVAGEGHIMMKVYTPDDSWETAMYTSKFVWNGVGNNGYDPLDIGRNAQIYNLSFNGNYPFDDFDERGIVFSSSNGRNGWSRRLKVRVIYKFELMIGEDYYSWWC